jgi:hypothetical protein
LIDNAAFNINRRYIRKRKHGIINREQNHFYDYKVAFSAIIEAPRILQTFLASFIGPYPVMIRKCRASIMAHNRNPYQHLNSFPISCTNSTHILSITIKRAGLINVCTYVAYYGILHKLRIMKRNGIFPLIQFMAHLLQDFYLDASIKIGILLLNGKLIQFEKAINYCNLMASSSSSHSQ